MPASPERDEPFLAFDAVLVDLEVIGLACTADDLQQRAWRMTFQELAARWRLRGGPRLDPCSAEDYARFFAGALPGTPSAGTADSRPAVLRGTEGVCRFLEARGIGLDLGAEDDPTDRDSVCAIANRAGQVFHQLLDEQIEVLDQALERLQRWRGRGLRCVAMSVDADAAAVVESAGLEELFDAAIGDAVSGRSGATWAWSERLRQAARRIGVPPRRAILVTGNAACVEAARLVGIGLVVPGCDASGRLEADGVRGTAPGDAHGVALGLHVTF